MTERVVRLRLAYDGTGFHGWARQPDPSIRTVEDSVSSQLERVLQAPVKLSVAGRTDAGVHARGQVASFSTASTTLPARLITAVNGALAPEVVVMDAAYAPMGFDARFSATAREYVYRVDEASVPDPFTARFVWHRPGNAALLPMRAAASLLLGEHDFTSFCRRPGGDRPTIRRLVRLSVSRAGPALTIRAVADSFLHQMVRSLVGTLLEVGSGKLDPGSMPTLLEARDRSAAGPLAPARGLTLERVVYGRRL